MERMFNLDPQLIQDVVITAVNIFILFLAGSYLMFNPVRNFLNKRKEGIADDIEKAKTDMQDAQAMKAEYEAKLKEVDKEVEAILADARKRALAREEQIIEEAKTEAAHIIEREKSTPVAMPKRMSTPSCCACFFMASINSAPSIPSGNPGKFSILVVVVS